jgi:hypothetical protein
MKTVIKLAITLVILTACFNAARAALNNFQFEDAAHQRLLFDPRATDEEVVAIVMKLSREYALPLREADISVEMVGADRIVQMPYTAEVPLLPGFYSYPWRFTPRTSTRMLSAVR